VLIKVSHTHILQFTSYGSVLSEWKYCVWLL